MKETRLKIGPGHAREWTTDTQPGIDSKLPWRIFVSVDPEDYAGIVEVGEAPYTSDSEKAERCGGGKTLCLNRDEARWLASILPSAIQAVDSAEEALEKAQKAAEEAPG